MKKLQPLHGKKLAKNSGPLSYLVSRHVVTKFGVGHFCMGTSNELPIGQNLDALKISGFSTD
jgi:hypothetical protein